jgi:hypothetical protein
VLAEEVGRLAEPPYGEVNLAPVQRVLAKE